MTCHCRTSKRSAAAINGKRYLPDVPTEWKGAGGDYRIEHLDRPYTFTLGIDPATLGAKATDQIEMELLCCPYGFQKLVVNRSLRGSSLDPIVLSNRVVINAPVAATQK